MQKRRRLMAQPQVFIENKPMHRESRRRIGWWHGCQAQQDVAIRRVGHQSQDVSKAPAMPGLFRCRLDLGVCNRWMH